jgi:predicted nucleic acid-binding protein
VGLEDNSAVKKLSKFHICVGEVPKLGIRVQTIPDTLIETAAMISRQTGLHSDDALILAMMRHSGLSKIASNDTDFDRAEKSSERGWTRKRARCS